jgi:Uma2 family endonuclease
LRAMASEDARAFTYGDYLTWPDDERWEIIDGVAYCMSPAPTPRHQQQLVEVTRQFANHLSGSPCRVYVAPFDVRLPDADEPDDAVTTVVQPDLAVVCDAARIDARGCRGAPDLVLEILSPSTSAKDQSEKLDLYERHGVREYWIVDPGAGLVRVYTLGDDGRFGRDAVHPAGASVPVAILPGLAIDSGLVLGEPPAPAAAPRADRRPPPAGGARTPPPSR